MGHDVEYVLRLKPRRDGMMFATIIMVDDVEIHDSRMFCFCFSVWQMNLSVASPHMKYLINQLHVV